MIALLVQVQVTDLHSLQLLLRELVIVTLLIMTLPTSKYADNVTLLANHVRKLQK